MASPSSATPGSLSGARDGRGLGVDALDVLLAHDRHQQHRAEGDQDRRGGERDLEAVEQRVRPVELRWRSSELREHAGRLVGRERREDGEPERTTDLLGVLNRPDASPASSSPTFVVAISVIGTKNRPMPIDCGITAGSTSLRYVPSTETPEKR